VVGFDSKKFHLSPSMTFRPSARDVAAVMTDGNVEN
jgi:hypothetical protein